jgi:hypothetical protein
MHGDTSDILPSYLELARMEPGANGNPDLLCSGAERQSAANRTARTVKSCKNAVTGRFDQAAAIPINVLFGSLPIT